MINIPVGTIKICPICNGKSIALDVVDFNKSCEESRGRFFPLSGKSIYYYQCHSCQFTFAPEFANWSEQDFAREIYNDQYIDHDPDYLERRPQQNFQLIGNLLNDQKLAIRHLDYGGGNGSLSALLKDSGWDSSTYDPYSTEKKSPQDLGKFNLITAFEVFEHVSDPIRLMEQLMELKADDALILFSTLTSDGNIEPHKRLTWWYASPRNGHISLHSKKSLATVAARFGLQLGSFSSGLHCCFNTLPDWAAHLMTAKPTSLPKHP
ncbi:MAG: class I SAM-dependent methyltransferase [Pseudomonadota bacterium]